MAVDSLLRRMRKEKTPPTFLEVSVGLAVALLLVMTGLRLLGGFEVDTHRGAQAAVNAEAAEALPAGGKTTRPVR